jgi:rhamnosyltransferase
MSISPPNIVAVVVTYQPDLQMLANVLAALTPQVTRIVVVDNGDQACFLPEGQGLVFLSLGGNRGIARAQNAGIALARRLGASHVLLMDQDSVAAPDMVDRLAEALAQLPGAACVGPRYTDERQQNPLPFVRLDGFCLRRIGCPSENAIVAVEHLIASGCLIPMSVLDWVGEMREDLFIEYVDTEWGLRARRHGFQSYGVCAATMTHRLGDAPIRCLGRCFPARSPLRHFYLIRNAVLLCREAWIPRRWQLANLSRTLVKFIVYSLFAKPRARHFWMMFLGLRDGLGGKTGEFHPSIRAD